MFTNALRQLPLTDEIASEMFVNISADSFEGDVSFCATMRKLLFERLQPNENAGVKLSFCHKNETSSESGTARIENGAVVFPHPMPKDTVFITVLKGHTAESFEQAKANSKFLFTPFCYDEPTSLYLSQSGCKAYVFVNGADRQTLVFMLKLTLKCWHKMQSAIPTLMPWYFPVPPDENERSLLRALTLNDSKTYADIISAYAATFNFHEDRLKRLLKDFGLTYEKQRLNGFMNERSSNSALFDRLQNEINACITKDRELETAILGIEAILAQGDSTGLTDYFICNKSLTLVSAANSSLTYIVMTYLEYFDQQVFEQFMKNPDSYFYKTMNGLAKDEAAYKRLLLALYGDDAQIRVRVCAEYTLSLPGRLEPAHQSDSLADYADWLPHPHVDGARCLGTNARYINELMLKKRYIEAIEQSIAATKNINFADSAIAPKLLEKIRTSSRRFLELPSGDVVSPAEALKWLDSQEG